MKLSLFILAISLLAGFFVTGGVANLIEFPPATFPNTQDNFFFAEFPISTATATNWQVASNQRGSVQNTLEPCQNDYYLLDLSDFVDILPGDYLHISVGVQQEFESTPGQPDPFNGGLTVFVKWEEAPTHPVLPSGLDADFSLDVFGEAFTLASATPPGRYVYPGNQQYLEISPCDLESTGFYWIMVGNYTSGATPDQFEIADYTVTVSLRRPAGSCDITAVNPVCDLDSITEIIMDPITSDPSSETVVIFSGATRYYVNDTREAILINQFDSDFPEPITANGPMYWRFFSVDVTDFTAYGTFIAINISGVETDVNILQAFYSFGNVPYFNVNDANGDSCNTDNDFVCNLCAGNDNFTASCVLTIPRCDIPYGEILYLGVLMTPSTVNFDLATQSRDPATAIDAYTSFKIEVNTYSTPVFDLALDTPRYFDSAPEYVYLTLQLSDADISARSDLWITIDGVTTTSTIQFFPVLENPNAYFCSDCSSDYDNIGCQTEFVYRYCDSRLSTDGTYFITVNSASSFTITATIVEKPIPEVFEAGVPVQNTLTGTQYAYHALNVPVFTEETWLYVELFTNEINSDLKVSMLSGAIPEDYCNAKEAEYLCQTSSSGRSGCFFMVDPCQLTPGTIYLTVESDHANFPINGVVQSYTIWAEFETAWELQNNVTYSDIVLTNQYNHYYIKVDEVVQGSWFTVEVDNVQLAQYRDGSQPTARFNTFLNYGSLAGSCPCFDSLTNCTGYQAPVTCFPSPDNWCNDGDGLSLVEYNTAIKNQGDLLEPTEDGDFSCCKLYASGCEFRAGIWYISVQGKSLDSDVSPLIQLSDEFVVDALGYTITAIIHPAPPVFELEMETPLVDWVDPQETNHYHLNTDFIYGEDLVIQVTWMMDSCFRDIDKAPSGTYESHASESGFGFDDLQLELRVAAGSLALPECFEIPWSCFVPGGATAPFSACEVIIPNCEWSKLMYLGDIFASVRFNNVDGLTLTSYAQFTLNAHTERPLVRQITPGVPITAAVGQNRYSHFLLPVDADASPNSRLDISFYFNTMQTNQADTDLSPIVSLNFDALSGGFRSCPDCLSNYIQCSNDGKPCFWSFDPCFVAEHSPSDWYFSVYHPDSSFFGQSLEFTVTASLSYYITNIPVDLSERPFLYFDTFYAGTAENTQNNHYSFTLSDDAWSEINNVDYLIISASSPEGGRFYFSYDGPAGECPCYSSACNAASVDNSECPDTVSDFVQYISPLDLVSSTFFLNLVTEQEGQVRVNFKVELFDAYTIFEETRVITGTTSDGVQFNLGYDSPALVNFDLTNVFLGDYNQGDSFDSWLTNNLVNFWNPENLYRDQVISPGHVTFYPVTITDGQVNQVFIAVDNVYSDNCPIDAEIEIFDLGCGDLNTLIGRSDSVCQTQNRYEADFLGIPLLKCANQQSVIEQVPYCSAACSGIHWFAVRTTNDDFDAHFDLRIFLQLPIPMPTLSDFNTSPRNVSHPNNLNDFLGHGFTQRFVIDDATINNGFAPITQIVIEKFDFGVPSDPIYIRVTPALPTTGFVSTCCLNQESSCVEFRSGLSSNQVTNAVAANPGTVRLTTAVANVNALDFTAAQPIDGFVCSNTQCVISLLPCAVKPTGATKWYLDVDIRGDNDFFNDYFIYYTVLGDRLGSSATPTTLAFPQSSIQTRTAVPDFEAPANAPFTAVSEYDTYFFYTLDMANYVSYVDNAQFRGRLEIQVYLDTLATPANAIVTIGRATPDGTNEPTFGAWGLPPMPAIVDFAIANHAAGEPTNYTAYNDHCCGEEFSYTCSSAAAATGCTDLASIFVVPECDLRDDSKFWIVLRVLQPGQIGVSFRVRVVESVCDPDGSRDCNDLNGNTASLVVPEGIDGALTLIGDAQTDSGIEPNAWVHHRIFLSSFLPEDTLVVDLQTDDLGTTEALAGTIYLRLSYQGVAQAPEDDFLATLGGIDERGQIIEDYCIDTALDFEFSCNIDGVSGNARINSRCILQVPSEELQVGVWFISLYYDRWYASHTDDLPNSVPGIDVLKGYTINVYKKEFNAPELCTLSTSSEVCNNCGGTLRSNPGIQQLSNVQPFDASDFANVEFNINYLVDTSPTAGVYEFYSIVVDDSITEILDRVCTDSASDTCIFEHELHVLVSNTDDSVTDVYTGPINVLYYAPASLIFNHDGEEHLVQRWQYWNSNGNYDADEEQLGLSEDNNSTLFTLTACPDRLSVALRVGTYYIAIQTTVENEYDICARIDQTSHGVFVRQTLTNPSFLPWGVFNAGDASVVTLWHDQVNTVTNPDGSSLSYYYRFRLDTIAEDQYVQVWLNDILNCQDNTNFPDSCSAVNTNAVRIEMFRDDCQSWSCPSGDCDIDTEYGISTAFVPSGNTFNDYGILTRYVLGNDGLALAGLDAGTYFVRVTAPDTTYFTFDVLLRTAFTDPDPLELVLNQDIILSPEIFSFIAQEATVWLYQYQIYTVDLLQQYPTGYTSGLIVTVGDVQCGQVHLSAKYGSPAGPPRKADVISENQAGAFVDSCNAFDGSPCDITIERCDLGLNFDDTTATWYFSVYGHTQQQKYENTFRGVQANEPTEHFNGPYIQPITYSIAAVYQTYIREDGKSFRCSQELVFSDAYLDCSVPSGQVGPSDPVNAITVRQFKWNVETTTLFSQVSTTENANTGLSFATCGSGADFQNTNPERNTIASNYLARTKDGVTFVKQLGDHGPFSIAPFILPTSTNDVASATVIRDEFFIATAVPGVVYSGTLARLLEFTDYAYYLVDAYFTGYFRVDVSTDSPAAGVVLEYLFDCSETWVVPVPSSLIRCSEYPRYIRISVSQSSSCDAPCLPVDFSFEITTFPTIVPVSCGDAFCESDPDVYYSLTEDNTGIFVDNGQYYGQIRYITGASSLYDPDFFCSPSSCPESDYYFQVNGGAFEAVCEFVPITELLGNFPLTAEDVVFASPDEVHYYRFEIPDGVDYRFTHLSIVLTPNDCFNLDYNLRYEALPSLSCHDDEDANSCNPLPGAYYIQVYPPDQSNRFDDIYTYTLTVDLIVTDNLELLVGNYTQYTLSADEAVVIWFQSDDATPDSWLYLDFVINEGGRRSGDVDYLQTSGLRLGLGDSYCYRRTDNYIFNNDTVGVPFCVYQPGVYYTIVRLNTFVGDNTFTNVDVTFSVAPLISNSGIVPTALSIGTPLTGQSVSTAFFVRQWNYYTVTPSIISPNSLEVFGQVRLGDVAGGNLHLAVNPQFFFYGDRSGAFPANNLFFHETPLEYSFYACVNQDILIECDTSAQSDGISNTFGASCAVALNPCYWQAYEVFYIVVSPILSDVAILAQDSPYDAITYTIAASEYNVLESPLTDADRVVSLLPTASNPDLRQIATSGGLELAPQNVDNHFFYFASTQSVTISVRVTGTHYTDGVWVQVNSQVCDTCSLDTVSFWCGADFDDYLCEFEVSTYAEFISGKYYVNVFGGSGESFTISATEGLANCEFPEASGSLDFCSGLLDYPVWTWSSYESRDEEARCLYHDLLAAFEDPSCDLVCKPFELSFECRQALQRFACYNSFRPCDESGFQTSTCRAACETVESQCVQTFSGVGYSRYSCGSANYIDNDSFPELRCAGPQLWLTEADTPVVVPDVLASYDNFAEVLLDNTLMPEQVFNYGFQAPTNLEN